VRNQIWCYAHRFIWTTIKLQDFPGPYTLISKTFQVSRTNLIFQDFWGPGNLRETNQGAARRCVNNGVSYITRGAVVVRLHVGLASVACVHKAITSLRVQLIQHRHRWELGASQCWELVVFLTRCHQERITTVHQVACHHWIWVFDRWQRGVWSLQSDHEEYLSTHHNQISKLAPVFQTAAVWRIQCHTCLTHHF